MCTANTWDKNDVTDYSQYLTGNAMTLAGQVVFDTGLYPWGTFWCDLCYDGQNLGATLDTSLWQIGCNLKTTESYYILKYLQCIPTFFHSKIVHSRWIQLLHIESRLDHSLRAGGRSENLEGQSVKGLLIYLNKFCSKFGQRWVSYSSFGTPFCLPFQF